MKKILIVLVCTLAGIAAKAQVQPHGYPYVLYIPSTNACYEGTGVSSATNGNYLVFHLFNAVSVIPTQTRMNIANSCAKGQLINDDNQSGTHNINCDETINETCFCVGIK